MIAGHKGFHNRLYGNPKEIAKWLGPIPNYLDIENYPQGVPVEDCPAESNRNRLSDKTVDADFKWLGKINRQALFSLLCESCNAKRGTTVEYTLLMPPIEKSHQFLSRDERHRAWDGYTWLTQ